ncbi:MAG: uracil-DNA glycosylase [Firmicutes bacterium]|nr:uracil-DNA glycosylase [Bacillota bacterium]
MFGNDWDKVLKEEVEKDYFKNLIEYIKNEYKEKTIYPKQTDIFKAFRNTAYQDIKVVILGQDPYHGVNQAEGLSFSVKVGVKKPPSLQNIFKELNSDLGCSIPEHGSLDDWTKEGILLLNTVLTVEAGKPASHKDLGWETFTDSVIKLINNKTTPVVFILWGSFARSKKQLITNPNHFIIESAHPSPFSAYNGFFGSKPFSKTNEFLISKGINPIDWEIK